MANVSRIKPDSELDALLGDIESDGVVLDFAFYESVEPQEYDSHFRAARDFLDECYKRYKYFHVPLDIAEYPSLKNCAYKWNPEELIGTRVSFTEFWGTDYTAPIGDKARSDAFADGFKTAFFLPPYGLDKPFEQSAILFGRLSDRLLGDVRRDELQIYSWSKQCSGYFDDGLQWWGAFLWTIARPDTAVISLIGASSTD